MQAADASNPFTTTWTPIIDVSGTGLTLRRTDVAATGRLAADRAGIADPGDDKIAALSLSGIDAPVTVGATTDCFLPTVGEASDPTISQDGTRIAWKDSQGVKVRRRPDGQCRALRARLGADRHLGHRHLPLHRRRRRGPAEARGARARRRPPPPRPSR